MLSVSILSAQKSERVKHGVALKNLTPDVALATCFKWLPVGDIPSNQVYIQTQVGGILSGIPWDIKQAQRLRKQIRKIGGKSVKYLVINELNEDRIPVIAYFKRCGIRLVGDTLTAHQLTEEYGIELDIALAKDTLLVIGKRELVLSPLGRGFAQSGLALFIPDCRLLHAGYFIPSPTARYPAIHPQTCLKEWANRLEKLYFRFSDAKQIVPGQGPPGNSNVIRRAILLIKEINRRNAFFEQENQQKTDAGEY